MLHRQDVTLLVVDNEKLKIHDYAYNVALNIIDHLVWYHEWGKAPWKFVTEYKDEYVKECNTKYCLVVKIGMFYHSSILYNNLDDDLSLAGYILDKESEYYEIHDKLFIVNVNDYDTK